MDYSNLLYESVDILVKEDSSSKRGYEFMNTLTILEDAQSPITKKYQEKLFQSVIDRGHIDFSGIEKSKGFITDYSGYNDMVNTIKALEGLSIEQKQSAVNEYVKTVRDAITNIQGLSSAYSKGFQNKSEYVMLEYNVMVYTCVEATTTLINEFVTYIKRPDQGTLKIDITNTKLRANAFYFEQLAKFNNVNNKMGIEYRKMLEALSNKDKNNFMGTEFAVGLAAISLVAMAIVPVTRALIYRFYKIKGDLSDSLMTQAIFLEMNKACVQANSTFTEVEKAKILKRQEELRKKLVKLSDKLRVRTRKAEMDGKRDLDNDNKMLSINSIRNDIDNTPLELV